MTPALWGRLDDSYGGGQQAPLPTYSGAGGYEPAYVQPQQQPQQQPERPPLKEEQSACH